MLAKDTIAAIATAPGQAALSIIRISGPQACSIASSCFSGRNLLTVDTHTAHVGKWMSPEGAGIDHVVATVFREPNSATGEDIVEVTTHGGEYVAALVLQSMVDQGARLASPGEFTQRAFLAGKLDLAQAEAVADLIHASSEQSHRISLSAYEGHYSAELNTLRTSILHLCALTELEIDFIEEDVEFADCSTIRELVEKAILHVDDLLQSTRLGTIVREGLHVPIVGRPNAGKSTLLNSLSGRDRSIVSEQPGTTRDVLEVDTEFGGLRFRFMDTAGLRQSRDPIEQEGVERAYQMMDKADIVVYVYDLVCGLVEEDHAALERIKEIPVIVVGNKSDLVPTRKSKGLHLSAKSGLKAVEPLIDRLLHQATTVYGNADSSRIVMNTRHHAHLSNALEALRRAKLALDANYPADIFSLDLHAAAKELGMITGVITNETILGAIFSRFCIGK